VRGFSLLELTLVLVLTGLTLGFAALSFGAYLQRASAQQAAQVFAQDLTLARAAAMRAREPVVIRFYESTRWYSVTLQESATELIRRRFGVNADIDLTAVDLQMTGDSVFLDSRGVVDLSDATGALGVAVFTSGPSQYTVQFNAMGASSVDGN